jgi:hypothetical protein
MTSPWRFVTRRSAPDDWSTLPRSIVDSSLSDQSLRVLADLGRYMIA